MMTYDHLFKGKSIAYDDKPIMEDAMAELTKWETQAKALLRAEMARRSVSYVQLVERLEAIGVKEDERNLRNKVARGKFTAAFFLQCLSALEVTRLDLG